jgi:hypothetical protein
MCEKRYVSVETEELTPVALKLVSANDPGL